MQEAIPSPFSIAGGRRIWHEVCFFLHQTRHYISLKRLLWCHREVGNLGPHGRMRLVQCSIVCVIILSRMLLFLAPSAFVPMPLTWSSLITFPHILVINKWYLCVKVVNYKMLHKYKVFKKCLHQISEHSLWKESNSS